MEKKCRTVFFQLCNISFGIVVKWSEKSIGPLTDKWWKGTKDQIQFVVGLGRATFFLAQVGLASFGPGQALAGPFLAPGQFGPPILAYFCQFLTNFSAKSAIFWFGLGRATQNIVRAGSGHPKSGPGRVGPLKIHGPRAKFRVGLWPDPALL